MFDGEHFSQQVPIPNVLESFMSSARGKDKRVICFLAFVLRLRPVRQVMVTGLPYSIALSSNSNMIGFN